MDIECDVLVVGARVAGSVLATILGRSGYRVLDNADVHATFLAEAIDDRLSGRGSEDEAFARYHARRDEHALVDFRETVELGRDLRQLAGA